MAQQEKLSSEINQLWDIYRKCMPDVAHAYDELPMEVFKNGVLSGKIKRLMAVVGGYEQIRQQGSHIIMQKKIKDSTITIPVPDHKEIRTGTLMSIIRQSRLDRSIFETG
jgi:predicted RNA binding protein YcfA (HicA-like mRNA interferase family)